MKIVHWTTTDVRRLRAMEGQPTLRVAAELGRTPQAIRERARKLGVKLAPIPHRLHWPKSTRRRAINLRRDGWPVSRVSKAVGVPFSTVRRWVYGETA